MKPYFSKLLTEQERAGSRNPSKKWGGKVKFNPDPEFDYEDEINFVSMARRRQYGYDHKEFTDVLAPLYGYLEKNIGRPWDKVYSELCTNLDRRSMTGQHVFTHLWQYVDKDTVMCEDGEVRVRNPYCGFTSPRDFYIHPYTGILCEAEDRRTGYKYTGKWPKNEDHDSVAIWQTADGMQGESYQRIDGIWYQCWWTKEDKFAGYHAISLTWGKNPWSYKQEVRVLKKRQLGKKQLKHLGLKSMMV